MSMLSLKCCIAIVAAILSAVSNAADAPGAQHMAPRSAFKPANYSGGDGLSKAKAVVLNTSSENGGIASEYVWVAHTYPGSKVLEQALSAWDHGKRYDILTIQTADKTEVELWFDITLMYK
jgi:hypothetical protein